MKFKYRAITLGCFAALGMVSTAQAVQVAGEALEIFGNVYPQYQIATFTDASTGALSPMTTGTAAGGTGVGGGTKVSTTQVNWTNSYFGFKGQRAFGDIRAGFEHQMTSDQDKASATTASFGDARDSYVFIAHKNLGTLQMGQMDTIYKEFGDRVRLLGTSSGNFTSTSNVISTTSFKTGSTTANGGVPTGQTTGIITFNTRINGQLRWISPNWNGVEVGVTLRPDPNKTAAQDQSLYSWGVRWSNATYYAGLMQETHNDYHGVSGTATAGIYNGVGIHSKDTAARLSFGYTAEKFRLGADISRLEYTEDAVANGKFTNYNNNNWQITGEYSVNPQVTVGGNYGVSGAGTCTLLNVACSTDGLGGTMLSVGARYDFDKNIGLFALYGMNNNNSSGQVGSGNIGGNVTNGAVGIQIKF